MFSISPYKLEMYVRCPRQYKFEYIERLKDIYHKEMPPLIIGTIVHAALNHYYRRLKREDRSFEKLRQVFKEKFIDHHKRKDPHYSVFDKNQIKVNEWVQKAVKQLQNFYNSNLSSIEPFLTPEYNPKVPLTDYGIELTGKLDRVDKIEGNLQIIDYKTGRLWEDGDDPLQLNFYHLLLTKLYPREKVVKKIYFYLDGNKFVEKPIVKDEIEDTLDFVIKTVEKIKNDNEFLPIKNEKCKFCDYQQICPAIKGN